MRFIFAIFSLLVTLVAYGRKPNKKDSYRSSGCDTKIKMQPGDTKDFSMIVDGFKREYLLHLPINYDHSSEYGTPTGLFLHGHRMLKELMASDFMRIIPQSDMFGYIAIIPEGIPAAEGVEACSTKDQGVDNEDKCTAWNDLSGSASPGPKGPICTPDNAALPRPEECADIDGNNCNYENCNVDDEKFIHRLMDDIESKYCVDISREYLAGYSVGGSMSHLLACTSTYRWAAVATLHGVRHRGFNCFPNNIKYDFSNDCYDWRTEPIPQRHLLYKDSKSMDNYGNIMYSMPLMNVCGTRDAVVPCYSELTEGQESGYGSGWYYIPVNEVSKDFAIANKCEDYALNPFNNRIRTKSDNNDWNWKCYGYTDKCKDDAWSIFCQYDGAHESLFTELYFGISNDNFILREVWNFWKKYKRIPGVVKEKNQCIGRKKKCLNDDECCSKKCKNAHG
eukprot:993694_1